MTYYFELFSVKQRCLVEQKKRRRRAIKKICIFIGSFVLCFAPYVITRYCIITEHKIINKKTPKYIRNVLYWLITL